VIQWLQILYKGQMRVPGVYASCRFARITSGTVNSKTEVTHCLQKHWHMHSLILDWLY